MITMQENSIINTEQITQLKEDIARLFDKDTIESIAIETGFVERQSKLTGHLFMMVFTFGMSIYKTPTLEQLVAILNLCIPGFEISRQAMHERINSCAVAFFEHMLSKAIGISMPSSLDLNLLNPFRRVIIVDSTSFQLPAELADIFPGSGGAASTAGIKIQFGYDLKLSHFFYTIQEGNTPDNSDKSDYVDFIEPEDLSITDLGYFKISNLIKIDNKNAYFLSRLKLSTKIYIKNNCDELTEIDLFELANRSNENVTETEIYIKNNKDVIKVRLAMARVPHHVYEQRLRRINNEDKKKGKMTSEKTKSLQAFNLYISNTPEALLASEHFRKLYCIRWQVELIFKNWKSNFGLDKVTGIREERVKCMIYAKLLLIFITTRLGFWIRNLVWIEMKRELSLFRFSKHIIVKANEWLRLVILEPEKLKQFLSNIIDFATKHCLKIPQHNRVYPLEMLEDLA